MAITTTLEQLLAPDTEEGIVSVQLAVLQAADPPLPALWWGKTGVAPVLIRADARAVAKLSANIPKIAKGGFLTLAAEADADGAWLDLKASSDFQTDRKTAIATIREVRLTNTTGAPVVVGSAGERWLALQVGSVVHRFRNLAGFTAPAGGIADVLFEAELAGTGPNDAGAWSWITNIAGVTIADGPLGITRPGTEKESSPALVARAISKWNALGRGSNTEAYRYMATTEALVGTVYDGVITRVKVERHAPAPGQVRLTIASADDGSLAVDGANVVAAPVVSLVQDFIDPVTHLGKAPNCTDVLVQSAVWKRIFVEGSVVAVSTELAAAKAAAIAALRAYTAAAEMGGTVDRERTIIGAIARALSADPRNRINLTLPAADVTLAYNEIPYFDVGDGIATGLIWTAA